MVLLSLGIVLWVGGHMFKRVAPDLRAAISSSFAFGGSNAVLAFRQAPSL